MLDLQNHILQACTLLLAQFSFHHLNLHPRVSNVLSCLIASFFSSWFACLLAALLACVCRNAVYFSNRSAAAANLGRFEEALQDAKAVLRLKPGWVKGHARAAAAYMGLQLYSEAKEVC
jgi:tetratricopeptide (TPR) repeat protein